MQELRKKLYELFGDVKLVRLEELVEKIANVSKVRIGSENRTTDQYYQEISLRDIDTYGIIHPPKNKEYPGLANATALTNQTLNTGDILISHRDREFTIGLCDGRYDTCPLIGQNSMIRIQFAPNRRVNTPLFVQAYLRLSPIRSYLNALLAPIENDKKLYLSSTHLLDLLIPYFDEDQNPISLKDLYYGRIDAHNEISHLRSYIHSADYRSLIKYQEMLKGYLHHENISDMMQDDQRFIEELHQIKEKLDRYLGEQQKRSVL